MRSRAASLLSYATPPAVPPKWVSRPPDVEADPFHAWLKMLLGGAVVGAMASIIAGTWSCLLLATRLRAIVPMRQLMNYQAAVTLAISACSWVAAMALTAEEPSIDSPRRPFGRILRWIVSLSFITISCWALRLHEELPQQFWIDWVLPTMQLMAAITTATLMIETRLVAGRLGYRSVNWRATVAALGLVLAAAMQYVPMFIPELSLPRGGLAGNFRNFRDALNALCATIAALVYLRFMFSVVGELWSARKTESSRLS